MDVISIDGFACADHPGEDNIGGLVLIPATVDKVAIWSAPLEVIRPH